MGVPPVEAVPARSPAAPLNPNPRGARGWAVLRLVLVVGVAAAVGSAVTYLVTRSDHAGAPAPRPSAAAPSAPSSSAQFSPAEVGAAKENLCHIVDLSVGQKSEGGLRVQGNLNVPVALKAINSALAVENALVPAVPPGVASAARKYISTTLDVTTAAMGNVPAPEVNRLTDMSNEAMNALVNACGLPR